MQEHQLPVQRACRVVRLSRAAFYRPPVPTSRRDAAVIAALTDVVARYPRWGFWKLFDRMRVEGRRWNHKHVHRVYCALRLNLPRRTTRRVPRRIRQPLAAPPVLNQTWALDFMTETLYDGRRVRLLTMIDEGNREGLEIAMGLSLPSRRVIRVLDELVAVHGCPSAVRVDNGPEFTAQTLRRLVHRARRGDSLHPARQARSERVHRTLQSQLSHRGPQRASLRIGRGTAGADRYLVADLQQRAAPRQPRPGAAAHVSAEAFISRPVSLRSVYLTGKLTGSVHSLAQRRHVQGASAKRPTPSDSSRMLHPRHSRL